eukprot:jgi/Tetstr1/459253/TSEL_000415.t1
MAASISATWTSAMRRAHVQASARQRLAPASAAQRATIRPPAARRTQLGSPGLRREACSRRSSGGRRGVSHSAIERSSNGAADDWEGEAGRTIDMPESGSPRRSVRLTFTCDKCSGRTERLVNPLALEKGLVYVQCGSCEVWHKIADNQGLIQEFILTGEEDSSKRAVRRQDAQGIVLLLEVAAGVLCNHRPSVRKWGSIAMNVPLAVGMPATVAQSPAWHLLNHPVEPSQPGVAIPGRCQPAIWPQRLLPGKFTPECAGGLLAVQAIFRKYRPHPERARIVAAGPLEAIPRSTARRAYTAKNIAILPSGKCIGCHGRGSPAEPSSCAWNADVTGASSAPWL